MTVCEDPQVETRFSAALLHDTHNPQLSLVVDSIRTGLSAAGLAEHRESRHVADWIVPDLVVVGVAHHAGLGWGGALHRLDMSRRQQRIVRAPAAIFVVCAAEDRDQAYAGRVVTRQLARAGFDVVWDQNRFLTDRSGDLLSGELDRARAWGRILAVRTRLLAR